LKNKWIITWLNRIPRYYFFYFTDHNHIRRNEYMYIYYTRLVLIIMGQIIYLLLLYNLISSWRHVVLYFCFLFYRINFFRYFVYNNCILIFLRLKLSLIKMSLKMYFVFIWIWPMLINTTTIVSLLTNKSSFSWYLS
jgi:hypothetical protein